MTAEPFVSYAQTMEDVMLWRALRGVERGFYIDVGAADPDRLSVTRAFYERGWHGIDIEPLPELIPRLQQRRPRDIVVEAALAETPGGTVTFYRVEKGGDLGLSTVDKAEADRSGGTVTAIEVPVTTLAALCREHVYGELHFLKIDVEGAEGAVLRGADFAVTRPWIVVVEAAHPLDGRPVGDDWHPVLEQANYVCVWFDGLNRFYVAQEHHAALAPHFLVPPNPFDHYRVADLPRDELLAATLELSQARLSLVEALRSELARLQPPQSQAGEAPVANAPVSYEPLTPPPRIGRARLAALAVYRLVRPLIRPLAWRLRSFLLAEARAGLGQTGQQLSDLSARLGQMHDEIGRLADQQTQRLAELQAREQAILERLTTLNGRMAESRARDQDILDNVAAIRARPALDADLAEAAEQLLLTLSLERKPP